MTSSGTISPVFEKYKTLGASLDLTYAKLEDVTIKVQLEWMPKLLVRA